MSARWRCVSRTAPFTGSDRTRPFWPAGDAGVSFQATALHGRRQRHGRSGGVRYRIKSWPSRPTGIYGAGCDHGRAARPQPALEGERRDRRAERQGSRQSRRRLSIDAAVEVCAGSSRRRTAGSHLFASEPLAAGASTERLPGTSKPEAGGGARRHQGAHSRHSHRSSAVTNYKGEVTPKNGRRHRPGRARRLRRPTD